MGQEEIISAIAAEAGVSLKKASSIVKRWVDNSDSLYDATYRVGSRVYKVIDGVVVLQDDETQKNILSEPPIVYGTGVTQIVPFTFSAEEFQPDKKYALIMKILGGKSAKLKLATEHDLIKLAKSKLEMSSLVSVSNYLKQSLGGMAKLLHVSERTLQRKTDNDELGVGVSQQLVRLAEVVARGIEVFGSEERFSTWLDSKSIALGGIKPKELLDTSFGQKIVLNQLGRIEHGIFS